jgi:hypothetical protein
VDDHKDPALAGKIRLVFRSDFDQDKLSEREGECLRAYLPGLIMELVQQVARDENEE